ncbi:hypothetical protein [Trichococcus shcherbakoviae]|uniref:hypothetical protein n=1 Tax=Trichococcus shcherbakoviae TaxID=2094020 RepID=UPI001F1C1C9A|nr:hypothetical protein [Trichococcus shcherbakoviae]
MPHAELTRQLLDEGDTVTETVRYICKISDLIAEYPTLFDCQILDLTDTPTVHQVVKEAFEKHGAIDIINNAARSWPHHPNIFLWRTSPRLASAGQHHRYA